MVKPSGRYNKKATARNLLDWRRIKVQELWNKGWDTRRIAAELQVSERIVYEDQRWLEKHSEEIMKNYLSNTVPHLINQSLQRLNLANREAWKVYDESQDKRTRLSALQVVCKTAIDSVTIVAGIRELVDFALDKDKYMASIQNSQNSQNIQSSSQYDQQTESEVVEDNNDSDNSTDGIEGETETEQQDDSQAKF